METATERDVETLGHVRALFEFTNSSPALGGARERSVCKAN